MNPTRLDPEELQAAEALLPPRYNQGKRMVRYLAEHPDANTAEVAHHCAVGNLSDVARNANRYLHTVRLFMACRRPVNALANRFGEPSNMFQWGLYRTKDD